MSRTSTLLLSCLMLLLLVMFQPAANAATPTIDAVRPLVDVRGAPIAVGASAEAFQDRPFRGRLVTSDADGDAVIVIRHPSTPANIVITNSVNGTFRWTPTEAQARSVDNAGRFVFRVKISDGTTVGTWNISIRTFRRAEGEHFEYYWLERYLPVAGAAAMQAQVNRVRDAFERGGRNAWDVEIDDMDYKRPKCRNSKIPIIIKPLGYMGLTSSSYSPRWRDEGHEGDPCKPSRIQISLRLTPSEIQATAAHEFFHAVQDFYGWHDNWWLEATAVWIEDKVFDNVNHYTGYLANSHSVFNRPGTHILDSYNYAGFVLPTFVTEVNGDDTLIRKSWELIKADPSKTAIDHYEDIFGTRKLQRDWREFVMRNLIVTGVDGHSYDEGASFGRQARIGMRFLQPLNSHYITALQSLLAAPIPIQAPAVYPPPLQKGMKIDHAQFRKLENRLPGLATHYVRFDLPVQLKQDRRKKSRLFLHFDGDAGAVWMADVIKINRDGSHNPAILKIVDHEKGERRKTIDFEIGGEGNSATEAFVVIISNGRRASLPMSAYRLSAVVTPGFQEAYISLLPGGGDRDIGTGTTKTAKNGNTTEDNNALGPDEDNIYRNGDSIKIEVDLSDQVHIGNAGNTEIPLDKRTLTADFSDLDSEYREGMEKIREKNSTKHIYTIEYPISRDNLLYNFKRSEREIPVKIRVTSLAQMDADKDVEEDKTFLVTIDNEVPEVKSVILRQQQGDESVTILDSEQEISNPAVIPVSGNSSLDLVIRFRESMQTHETDGTEINPDIWIEGASEQRLTFRKTGGWKNGDKGNDTWEGELDFSREVIKLQTDCTLFVRGRDKAGNELDLDVYLGGIQPDDRHVFQWRNPAIASVLVSQGADIVYDSIEELYREGKPGRYQFQLIFNEEMEQASLSFGQESPYAQAIVNLSPDWTDRRVWEGEFNVPSQSFSEWEGAHRISVSGVGMTGLPLDSNSQMEGEQPDTDHVFLIGKPRAWLVQLLYNEVRLDLVQDPRYRDYKRTRSNYTTSLEARLWEDWVTHRWNEPGRNGRYSQRAEMINTLLSVINDHPGKLAQQRDDMVNKYAGQPGVIGHLERSIRHLEAELDVAQKALRVLQKIRVYTNKSVDVSLQGHVQGEGKWFSGDKVSSEFSIVLDLAGCDYRYTEPTNKNDPYREYFLVLSSVTRKEWDSFVAAYKRLGELGGGKVFGIIPSSWPESFFWPSYYNIHDYPDEEQEIYSLTLAVDIRDAAPMQNRPQDKSTCTWHGTETAAYSSGNNPPPVRIERQLGRNLGFDSKFNHIKFYPMYDYTPFWMEQVYDTPELKRFRDYPNDPQTSNTGRVDAYQPRSSAHFHQFLPGSRGLSSVSSYTIRGLDDQLERLNRKKEGTINFSVRLTPLPEGEL